MGWSYMWMPFTFDLEEKSLLRDIRIHNLTDIKFVGEPITDLQMAHLICPQNNIYILIFGNPAGARITTNFLRGRMNTMYPSLPFAHCYENVVSIDLNGKVIDVSYCRDSAPSHPKRITGVEVGIDAFEFLQGLTKSEGEGEGDGDEKETVTPRRLAKMI